MSTRTRYRASQVIIDTPKTDGEVLINTSVQKLEIGDDGKVVTEYPRTQYIHKIASHIATDIVTVYDPVLGHDVTLSIAGIHLAVQAHVVEWIMEKYPNTVLEGELVWEL